MRRHTYRFTKAGEFAGGGSPASGGGKPVAQRRIFINEYWRDVRAAKSVARVVANEWRVSSLHILPGNIVGEHEVVAGCMRRHSPCIDGCRYRGIQRGAVGYTDVSGGDADKITGHAADTTVAG